jgi:hypothetical protein
MVDFGVTPPYVIPIAIALAVLAVATFKAPEKAPDFYRVTIDLPKVAYDTLARKATVDTPVSSIPSFHVTAKVSVNARDCCSSSAKRSTRGLSLCSGMLGIRS